MTVLLREPFALDAMPLGCPMEILDQRFVRASSDVIFGLARDVEHWPGYLPHYRWVRFRERARDGGGIVEMAAWRPFGPLGWPTWWVSEMAVDEDRQTVRFHHIAGITRGMQVEWTFTQDAQGTHVFIVHAWNGPAWPLIGIPVATKVIGPVFVHGIASRTLAGLAAVAERPSLSPTR